MTMELTDIAEPDDGASKSAGSKGTKKGKSKPLIALDSEILGDVEVRLTAMLGEGIMSVNQLLTLTDGSVVDLETPLDGQIDLVLNGKLIAKGEIVAVGDRFGVRITQLVASKT